MGHHWQQYMQNFFRTPLVREFYCNADSSGFHRHGMNLDFLRISIEKPGNPHNPAFIGNGTCEDRSILFYYNIVLKLFLLDWLIKIIAVGLHLKIILW